MFVNWFLKRVIGALFGVFCSTVFALTVNIVIVVVCKELGMLRELHRMILDVGRRRAVRVGAEWCPGSAQLDREQQMLLSDEGLDQHI